MSVRPDVSDISTMIDEAYLRLVIKGVLDNEKYDIRMRRNFDTACWSFVPPHLIFVGDQIFKNCTAKPKAYYAESYLIHEVGHSLFTERDLKAVNLALGASAIPFKLLNLAEDARIEWLMRSRLKRCFRWAEFETLETPLSPRQMLFYIIQHDGGCYVDEMTYGVRVREYYERFIAADSTWDIVDILEEWMSEFQEEEEQENNNDDSDTTGGQGGSSDLKEGLKLMTDPKALQAALNNSENVAGEDLNKKSKNVALEEEHAVNSNTLIEYSNCKVSLSYLTEWDKDKAVELASLFESLFVGRVSSSESRNRSNKYNRRAFRPYIFSANFYLEERTERRKAKEVVLVVDTSASMRSPFPNMRVVIGTFNELAKRGHVSGYIVLSANIGGKASFETFAFPVADEVIASFSPEYGGEGINGTLKSITGLLAKAEHIFVLTDGNISDEAVEKDFLHAKGIYTTGIYIGDADYTASLSRWFDQTIVAETLESCSDYIIQRIAKG